MSGVQEPFVACEWPARLWTGVLPRAPGPGGSERGVPCASPGCCVGFRPQAREGLGWRPGSATPPLVFRIGMRSSRPNAPQAPGSVPGPGPVLPRPAALPCPALVDIAPRGGLLWGVDGVNAGCGVCCVACRALPRPLALCTSASWTLAPDRRRPPCCGFRQSTLAAPLAPPPWPSGPPGHPAWDGTWPRPFAQAAAA